MTAIITLLWALIGFIVLRKYRKIKIYSAEAVVDHNINIITRKIIREKSYLFVSGDRNYLSNAIIERLVDFNIKKYVIDLFISYSLDNII